MANGRYFDNGTQRVLDDQSTQPCGCDPGIGWQCDTHRPQALPTSMPNQAVKQLNIPQLPSVVNIPQFTKAEPKQLTLFPMTDKGRKSIPVWTGVIMYFPRAIREIAKVSQAGNDQHNPGETLHWAKHKSTNQSDTAMRHRMDHGVGNYYDSDGTLHLAKTCWRDLAELETFLEEQENER